MLSSQDKFEAFVAGVLSYDTNLLHYEHHDLLEDTILEPLNYTILRDFEEASEVNDKSSSVESLVESATQDWKDESYGTSFLEPFLTSIGIYYQFSLGVYYQFLFGGFYKTVGWLLSLVFVDGKETFEASTMAETGHGASGGIPLHEFRREVPPGWSPNLPDYPLRLYFERLKLWYRIYDGADELVGPLVAGRLQGKAQRLSMQLRLPRPDGSVDVGSDALVRLSVEEVRDPVDPNVVLQRAIPSGVQALCNAPRDTFGMSDQEMVSRAIEDLFEFPPWQAHPGRVQHRV